MNINLLREIKIVAKEDHFVPLVFVDLAVPTSTIAALGYTLSKELSDGNGKRDKMMQPATLLKACNNSNYSQSRIDKLINSIDDISF